MRADVRNRKGGAELGDENGDGHDRIMPATVAPAEDADILLLQLAERGGMPAPFFLFQMLLLHASHSPFRPVVPLCRSVVPEADAEVITISKGKRT
jgi:hypothetical protein